MGWTFIGNTIVNRRGGGQSWSSYWSPPSAVVENAAPTDVVLTYAKSVNPADVIAGNFAIAGKTISSATLDVTGKILTLVVSVAFVYGDSITVVANGENIVVTNNITAEAELTTYITGLATPLSIGQRRKINEFIKSLKTGLTIANLSDAFDVMYLLAGETEESSLKNLVSNAYHCTKGGTVTFTQYLGEAGDGTTGYLKTGYKPKSNGVKFLLDDSSLGIFSNTNVVRAQTDMGCRKATNDDRTFINCQQSALQSGFYINTDSSGVLVSVDSGKGLFIASRTANNLTTFYKDGIKLGDSDVSSSDRPDYELYICANNSADSLNAPSTNQIAFAFAGKGFSQLEQLIITNAYYEEIVPLRHIGYNWYTKKVAYDTMANKSFIGLTRINTQVILTIDHSLGYKQYINIGSDIVENDDHNEPSILIRSSDNKLVVAYMGHSVYSQINFKISNNALDETSFSDAIVIDPDADSYYAYPNLYEVVNEDIYLFYREYNTDWSGNYGWSYVKSTDGGATWSSQVRFLDKRYAKIAQDPANKNIIHFLACNHPDAGTDPNTISHFYFDASDEKYYKSDGTDVTASIPLTSANMTTIFTEAHPAQFWQEDIIIDSNGYPRVLMTYYPDVSVTYLTKYLYYSEWNGSAWTTPYEVYLSMIKNIALSNPNREGTYAGMATFDLKNADRIISSKEVDGVMEIFELTRVASNNFTSVQITEDSEDDQWRPFTTSAPNNNVIWLNKDYYNTYTDFDQTLVIRTL